MIRQQGAPVLVLVLVTALSMAGVSNAQTVKSRNSALESAIMAPDYANGKVAGTERAYLLEHPDVATKRAEKDAKYLLDQADQQMNQTAGVATSAPTSGDVTIQAIGSPKTIRKGQWYYSNYFDSDNQGGSRTGGALWAAKARSGWDKFADVSITGAAWADASAWAWMGNHIRFEGDYDGQKWPVVVTFNGKVKGSVLAGIGGSSCGRTRVSIYDYTDGSEVGAWTIWEDCSSNIIGKSVDKSFTQQVSATLISGHTYLLRFGQAASFSMYGPQGGSADFWSDGRGPEGLDADWITVDAR